jgi:hypothetical protein
MSVQAKADLDIQARGEMDVRVNSEAGMQAKANSDIQVQAKSKPDVQAKSERGPRPFPGSKITFAPLPVEIFMQPGQKPAVVFTTPCIQIERMTNGFPPILAFENFMLEMIGKVNDSELLPIRLEPVCI